MNDLKWFAYIHVNGTLHVKRFFDTKDLIEADESPFVARRTSSFVAENADKALEKAEKILRG